MFVSLSFTWGQQIPLCCLFLFFSVFVRGHNLLLGLWTDLWRGHTSYIHPVSPSTGPELVPLCVFHLRTSDEPVKFWLVASADPETSWFANVALMRDSVQRWVIPVVSNIMLTSNGTEGLNAIYRSKPVQAVIGSGSWLENFKQVLVSKRSTELQSHDHASQIQRGDWKKLNKRFDYSDWRGGWYIILISYW